MAWASITYTFSPSTMAKSSEVNQNFADVVAGLNKAMPSGGIIIWANSIGSIPSGWYLCDGNNGTPNLVGKYIQGAGSGYAVGGVGGEANHTLLTSEMPAHNHTDLGHSHADAGHNHTDGRQIQGYYNGTNSDGNFGAGSKTSWFTLSIGYASIQTNYANIQNNGGGGAHNNLPPFMNLAFIMKS